MLLGQVVGTIVSTQKDEGLQGLKLLLVQGVNEEGEQVGNPIVCADSVGAGVGELILYAAGSSARQTEITKNRPVDHVIMAIVDEYSVGEVIRYKKDVGYC